MLNLLYTMLKCCQERSTTCIVRTTLEIDQQHSRAMNCMQ